MKIVERIPKTQTQELIRFEDGSEVIRCYSPSNPHYYKNHKDELLPIDLSFEKESTSKVGNIRIREKNVNSVGYREDNNPYKYIGIRPDRNQELGTEQLEFTLKEIVVNDEDIPIDLSKNDVLEGYPNIVNLGNVLIHAARQFTRQIINPDRTIETFKITYLIHTTGLNIANDKDEAGFYIADEEGEFSFSSPTSETEYVINLPLLLDENFEEVSYGEDGEHLAAVPYEGLTRHTLKDMGDGVLEYIKYSSGEQLPETAKYIDVSACGGNTPCPSTDGYLYMLSSKKATIDETWSIIKSLTKAANGNYNGSFGFTSNFVAGSYYKMNRSYFKFDTSGISSAALVTFNYWALTVTPTTGQQTYHTAAASATITVSNANNLLTGGSTSAELTTTDGTTITATAHASTTTSDGSDSGTFEVDTSSTANTAANLTTFLNSHSKLSATRSGSVVTVTQAEKGQDGNTVITITDPGDEGLTNTDFSGGVTTNTNGQLSDGTSARVVVAKSDWSGNAKPSKYDWDNVAISQYGTAVPYSDTSGTDAVQDTYNVVGINSTGISDINNNSEFKFAVVTYHDYADQAPPDGMDTGVYSVKIAQTNFSGLSKDPYLDITEGYAQTVIGVGSSNYIKIIGMTNQQVKNVMGA